MKLNKFKSYIWIVMFCVASTIYSNWAYTIFFHKEMTIDNRVWILVLSEVIVLVLWKNEFTYPSCKTNSNIVNKD